ncbi:hypothetical protein, partial [Streptococcus alactolyticus]|uniref:hypothetical protein n=1 Tax=Streptococcus alactolyticus TaxID=29389 RepID=UPI003F9BEB71
KSHLLKTGLTTIQRNYSIINLLKSFYRLANLNLKFGLTENHSEKAEFIRAFFTQENLPLESLEN